MYRLSVVRQHVRQHPRVHERLLTGGGEFGREFLGQHVYESRLVISACSRVSLVRRALFR